ncbi:MAG: GNAT family N-acetyltransferase [Pseudomonadales bacterium]|nr:GNAT family N-acetyltransferase [Pseudomonadales bacterium]MDG1441488.1 GNAT family N-acetyltransferase [Pseudomonadales bacterium]
MLDLKNIIWKSLSGSQKNIALGGEDVRRFKRGVSELVGFVDNVSPNFDELAELSKPGDSSYSVDWSGPVPSGWGVLEEMRADQMMWRLDMVDTPQIDIVPLNENYLVQMLDLIELTRPGPFQPGTIEMGDYFGVFDQGELVAMAGERLFANPFREISGVCTRPGYEGRGLARSLMQLLIGRQLQRNEVPFLHVVEANINAKRIYEKMGFESVRKTIIRQIVRT